MMALTRRLALKILNLTTQLASPGARDWANAMFREMDFIENDWTSLRWAIGSTRIIFKRRDVPLANASDIPRAAQSLTKKIRRRTVGGYAVTLLEIGAFGSRPEPDAAVEITLTLQFCSIGVNSG